MGVAGGGVVRSELAEAPEGETGRQRRLGGVHAQVAFRSGGGELDRGNFQITKERSGLGAVAHEDELDLGEDEAVAAAVLAHDMVEGTKTAEILDALDVALDTHASVEAIEAADQADDAGGGLATEHGRGSGRLSGGVGNEDGLVDVGRLGRNGEVQGSGGGGSEGRIKLGEVERGINAMKRSFSLGVAGGDAWLRKERCRDGGVEESGGTGEGEDGGGIEAVPRADVADVPPEVLGVGVAEREGDGSDQRGGRVGHGEEVEKGGGGSRVRSGSEAQRRVSTRAIVAAGEHVVGLLGRHVERRHGTVGWVAILVKRRGVEATAGGTTGVHGNDIVSGKVGGRAEERAGQLLGLAGEGQVGRGALEHEGGEALGAGVASNMTLAATEGSGSGRGAHAVVLRGDVNLLVLRSDLGEQERAMLSDGRRSTRRGGEASAD